MGRAGDGRGAACSRSRNLDVLQAGLHSSLHSVIVGHAEPEPVALCSAPSSRMAGPTVDASDATPVSISCSLGLSSTPISGA